MADEADEDADLPKDEAGRRKIKRQYERLLGIRIEKLRGPHPQSRAHQQDHRGHLLHLRRCLKVCHSLDDGLTEDPSNQNNHAAHAARPARPPPETAQVIGARRESAPGTHGARRDRMAGVAQLLLIGSSANGRAVCRRRARAMRGGGGAKQDRCHLQLIRPDINLDFVGKRYFFVALSTSINLAAIILLFTVGLNYGVDFVGGSVVPVAIHRRHRRRPYSQSALRRWISARSRCRTSARPNASQFLARFETVKNIGSIGPKLEAALDKSYGPGAAQGVAGRDGRRQGRQRSAAQRLRGRHHRDHLHGRLHRDPVSPRELELRRRRRDRADP